MSRVVGTNLDTATFQHYITHVAGPPIFRYDKSFQGKVITASDVKNVQVMFHVRPWGMNLDYDYPKRKQILKEASALLELAPNVYDIITRTYTETIGHLVNREESPLLDEPTRKKVIAKFKQLRRGSIISDFEN